MTIVLVYCSKVGVKQALLPARRIFSSLSKVRKIGILFSRFVVDYYCLKWMIHLIEFKTSWYKKEISCDRLTDMIY